MNNGQHILHEDESAAEAYEALGAGRFAEADLILEQALQQARLTGQAHEIDRALCRRAAAAIEVGKGDHFIKDLREILLRSSSHESCYLAASVLARSYDIKSAYKKALFYARLASGRAQLAGRNDWLATSHNLIGNQLLAESFFEEACREYELALRLAPSEAGTRRAIIKDNLGYCYVVQGRHTEGFRLLVESYRTFRKAGATRYSVGPSLSLAYAYLEMACPEKALRRGRSTLALAECVGDTHAVKNSLYILGEAANLLGDTRLARSYFSRLQQDYYPGAGYLPDFLLAIDVRKLVNLKA
ncbi:MAG TPA: hypothetical protein DD490_10355 [Acidobacteria bacterium]|nr:hypothetical protein [Acidobacteriota bacterium]